MKSKFVIAVFALVFAPLAHAQCVGDIALDARVDGGDLGVLLADLTPLLTPQFTQ
jgi:hypothetical protein